MGTSSSYGGSTGPSPLLPPWAQDDVGLPIPPQLPVSPDADGLPAPGPDSPTASPAEGGTAVASPPVQTGNLRGAKASMTRYTRGGGGQAGSRRAGRNYVRGKGGARGAAAAARSGRAATGRLGGFLASVAASGLRTALERIGLADVIGRPAEYAMAAIANAIAPSGATLEDAAARTAVNEALYQLYARLDLEGGDLTKLDSMDAATVQDMVESSVISYVYTRWLQELGKRIEANAVTVQEALRLEREIKQYVTEAVHLDFADVDVLALDWNGPSGRRIVERIYRDAYSILEA